MSAIYFRRWTRMYLKPAVKYFHKYGVLQPGYEQFIYLSNVQDPEGQNKSHIKKVIKDKQQKINTKLINKLFNKYPDLKYESVNRQKYEGDSYISYSYAYAFIAEQKKLMKTGYKQKKAFEIVEGKFQDKMKRKMDQTLLARGLAIGNRARSFLTIYQQQVQYQSRLKMLRTKREVVKYEKQLEEVQNALSTSHVNIRQQSQQNEEHYERMFTKITQQSDQALNEQFKDEKRKDLIERLQQNFRNTFQQFYERAAYRDRLNGLTDNEIKQQIMASPQKIKRQTRQLIKFLKKKGDISINQKGEIRVSDGLSDKMKSFIFSSPTVRIAILNDLMEYESPRDPMNRTDVNQSSKIKLAYLDNFKNKSQLSDQDRQQIRDNRLKQYEMVVESQIPANSQSYRIFESTEERMLRLQIKYYRSLIRSQQATEETFDHLKKIINKFRRLKFRMEKRFQRQAADQLAFPEHYQIDNWAQIQKDAEYEQLLTYLRKKTQERRLKAIDQVDDDKINEIIKNKGVPQIPQSEGDIHKT